MQTAYSGNVTFTLDTRREIVNLSRVPSISALNVFAGFLHQYTVAEIEATDFIESTYFEGALSADASGTNKDLNLKALIMLKMDPIESGVYPFKQLAIPAPRLGMFENVPNGVGYRVKAASGEAIASAYSTLTGKTWRFKRGSLIGGG